MQNRQNDLLIILWIFILSACSTGSEDAVQGNSSIAGNNTACVERLWPRKENFRPLPTANNLFECIGKDLQLQLKNQGIETKVDWLIPDYAFARMTHTQKTPITQKLFSIGVLEPCYFQQKYNQIPSEESLYFIFDTMIDCIINAAYEHWQYGSILFHTQSITQMRVSITPILASTANTCMENYRKHSARTPNALPRLRSLQQCLLKAIRASSLSGQEDTTPIIAQDNTQLKKEELEALEAEILTDEDKITVDAKTVRMIEACIEEYRQSTADINIRTEKLIDCSINSTYKRMTDWNVNIKANIIAFSSQDELQSPRDMKFDLIIPLWKDEKERQMIAIQPGFLISVYSHEDHFLQGGAGLLYRLAIKNGIIGFNIFNDVHIVGNEASHHLSIGLDYQDEWNHFAFNYYPPLSEWLDLNEHRKKKQIEGFDLKITRTLSNRFYISTTIAFWEGISQDENTVFLDGVVGYNINCQMALEAGVSYDVEKNNFTGHLDMSVQLDSVSQNTFSGNCHRKNPSYSMDRKADRANNPLR